MAFNPFRDLIDVLTGRTGEPTIPTADEPARVRNTGDATASGPGAFANTGSIRTPRPHPPRAPRIDTDALRRATENLARAAQNTRTTTRTTISGGRGVSVNTDRRGSSITVNGRTITITPDGTVTIDGVTITDDILDTARRNRP